MFLGVATNAEGKGWPYRYRIGRTANRWSGVVDIQLQDQWAYWDKIEIFEQKDGEFSFRASFGEPGKAIPTEWHFSLGVASSNGFQGKLTGNALPKLADGSAAPIVIEFKPK